MFYLILSLLVLVSLAGGIFYGYSYMKARALKKPVTDTIIEIIDDKMKPNV